jgi:hypothetical protein
MGIVIEGEGVRLVGTGGHEVGGRGGGEWAWQWEWRWQWEWQWAER